MKEFTEHDTERCWECGADPEICPCSCDHYDLEDGYCLQCGQDCTEWLAGRSEDIWEGDR
jgi:hypothetical protein